MTIKEAAAAWNLTERRVNELCKTGRIEGAIKDGQFWYIPDGAQKPMDSRLKNGNRPVHNHSDANKLPLPIGVSDYRKACSDYYYVDKTLLIKEFLDERPIVSLFTRPRRFGKTLTMDMLRTFFEKTGEDSSVYFRDKKIWACGQEYRKYQGKFPVIYVTFKDVKCETWDATYDLIAKTLRNEFERHNELLDSDRISPFDKNYLTAVLSGTASKNDIALAFSNLSRMLHVHHGEAPIIIIDEYDTPIQQGHMRGFYDEVVGFMRNLFSGGLKDNSHLSYGFLTGILRVAKESIFSGLNNLKINSILDNRYSEYFGFTLEEVQTMAEYYGVPEKVAEVCEWYDGYRFGKTDIFNPWSVIGYFNNECKPRAFWQSTGSNDIIQEVLASATPDTMERLQRLVLGESFLTKIDTDVIYPQIQNNPSSIYSFLLVAGYLKAITNEQTFGEDYMCEVSLPNKEISYVYRKEILSRLESGIVSPSVTTAIHEAIFSTNTAALQKHLRTFLLQTVSFFDTANESFYHGLVLGLCAVMQDQYQPRSNRESGEGRYDLQLMPKKKSLPGILIELKVEKEYSSEQLDALAASALEQINIRKYDTEMTSQGISHILKYGIAFSGKDVRIAAASDKNAY